MASYEIFHHEVSKAFEGLTRVTNTHESLSNWDRNNKEHYKNSAPCPQKCAEKGIILKLSNEVDWFVRQFKPHGIAADPMKIRVIIEGGHPSNAEDARLLFMACQYNAEFAFDQADVPYSYEQITQPDSTEAPVQRG